MIQREAALHTPRVVLASGVCLAAVVLLLNPGPGIAEAPGPLPEGRVVALSAVELEETFWVCDYTATTVGMDATPVALCGAVYDELKARKFGGDFELLLAWWRQNKPAEHDKLAARTDQSQVRLRR